MERNKPERPRLFLLNGADKCLRHENYINIGYGYSLKECDENHQHPE